MKKITAFFLSVLMCQFIFTSFSPSLDGRAVIADQGMMPEGLFARTVGYLPGDSISVTNLAKKISVDILVIGALDPSEGVAILLSPEAAKVLGMEKNANNVVKITKRSGQLDEQVSGTAVIADAPALPPAENEDQNDSESERDESSENNSENKGLAENDGSEKSDSVDEKIQAGLADAEDSESEEDFNYDWNSDSEKEDLASSEPFAGDEDFVPEVAPEEVITEIDEPDVIEEESSEKIEDDLTEGEKIADEEKVSEEGEETLTPSDNDLPVNEGSGNIGNVENAEGEKVIGDDFSDQETVAENDMGENIEATSIEEALTEANPSDSEEDKPEVISATVAEDIPESEPFVEKIEEDAEAERLAYTLEEEKVEADLLSDPVESKAVGPNVPDSVSTTPFEEEGLAADEKVAEEEASDADEKTESEKLALEEKDEKIESDKIEAEKLDNEELASVEGKSEDKSDQLSNVEEEKMVTEESEAASDDQTEGEKIQVAASEKEIEEAIESEKIDSDDLSDLPEEKKELALSDEAKKEENLPVESDKLIAADQEMKEEEKTSVKSDSENLESKISEEDELVDYSDFSEKVASKMYEEAETEEEGYAPIILVQAEPKAPEYSEKDDSEYEAEKARVKAEEAKREEASKKEKERAELAAKAAKENRNVQAERKDKSVNWRKLVTENSDLKKGYWYVQAALLSEPLNIEQFVTKYAENYPICLVPLSNGRGYQVLVGALGMDEYGTVLNRFKSYGFKDAFVKRIR
ncbi:MAG: hypothetical protein K6E78_00845 [Treponema sp.]|nr:hypothetical protein [Treponema sp.]